VSTPESLPEKSPHTLTKIIAIGSIESIALLLPLIHQFGLSIEGLANIFAVVVLTSPATAPVVIITATGTTLAIEAVHKWLTSSSTPTSK
jgi:hypothetical protein